MPCCVPAWGTEAAWLFSAALWQHLPARLAQGFTSRSCLQLPISTCIPPLFQALYFSALLLPLPFCRHVHAPGFALKYNPDSFSSGASYFMPASSHSSSSPQPTSTEDPRLTALPGQGTRAGSRTSEGGAPQKQSPISALGIAALLTQAPLRVSLLCSLRRCSRHHPSGHRRSAHPGTAQGPGRGWGCCRWSLGPQLCKEWFWGVGRE